MSKPVDGRIASLPHWARVAFAGRCAESTLPLSREAWPNALPKHLTALETAIRLTWESATNGVPAAGLQSAVVEVVKTAETALAAAFKPPSEPGPHPNGESACRVSFSAARAAASAAEAAMNGPGDSVKSATAAFDSARQAAASAESPTILAGLERDLDNLIRLARENRWTDATPVEPSVFLSLSEERPPRPWWKFW